MFVNKCIPGFWSSGLWHCISGWMVHSISKMLGTMKNLFYGPLGPWRWRHSIPSKGQEAFTYWCNITSHKPIILNYTTAQTLKSQMYSVFNRKSGNEEDRNINKQRWQKLT